MLRQKELLSKLCKILQANILTYNYDIDEEDDLAIGTKAKNKDIQPAFLDFDHLEVNKPKMSRRLTKRKVLPKF